MRQIFLLKEKQAHLGLGPKLRISGRFLARAVGIGLMGDFPQEQLTVIVFARKIASDIQTHTQMSPVEQHQAVLLYPLLQAM